MCLTGKPFIFAVGADLSGVPAVTDRDQALELGLADEQFRRLSELPLPVSPLSTAPPWAVAWRSRCTATTGRSPPEPQPSRYRNASWPGAGLGGTYLLPNLIGAAAAVKVIIENPLNQNKQLKPGQALDLGIADALFEPADFLEQSLTARVVTGDQVVERVAVDRGPAWEDAVAAGRAFVAGKVGAAAPAPLRALDLIELARTADADVAFAAEDEALADLVMSQELRAGLYAFDLVQKRAKRPAGAPDRKLALPVTKVGVVGAGLMASCRWPCCSRSGCRCRW